MNGVALPKQVWHDWDVEFVGTIHDGHQEVDCMATVVLDYDGTAYEVLRASYFTPENIQVEYVPDERETAKLFAAAQKQFERFMEEA